MSQKPEFTHTKIMKQGAGPDEGHHILTTHKTDPAKHVVYHVDPKGLVTQLGDHTHATELKTQLETRRTTWSPGQHLELDAHTHRSLIIRKAGSPAGVFSNLQTGSAPTGSAFTP